MEQGHGVIGNGTRILNIVLNIVKYCETLCSISRSGAMEHGNSLDNIYICFDDKIMYLKHGGKPFDTVALSITKAPKP
jgi:hypothetical protein